MSAQHFDVVVVGASVAGCTAATLLARGGAKVALLERHADVHSHKRLCTHFIQASAWPVMAQLGLDRLIEAAGGVPNGIEVHSPYGWIGHLMGAGPDGRPLHGYNIRRGVLDPMMRELAANTPGVTLFTGMAARQVVEEHGCVVGVDAHGGGQEVRFDARLVVAADGRHSDLATRAGAPVRRSPNLRHCTFVQVRGALPQRGTLSQMWVTGPEALYCFPNEDGVCVLAWVGPKTLMASLSSQHILAAVKTRFAQLPDAPDLSQAQLLGDAPMLKDFPNQWRRPVLRGMALVGDAAASLDYIHGVGCGWAMQSAALLAECVTGRLHDAGDLAQGLRRYERKHHQLIGPNRFFINEFSKRLDFNLVEKLVHAAAARDPIYAQQFARAASRMVSPWRLFTPALLARALWAVATSRTRDTRQAVPATSAWPVEASAPQAPARLSA